VEDGTFIRIGSTRMRNVCKALSAVVLFAAVFGTAACSGRQQLRREENLRKELVVLRREIDLFTVDNERRPTSLDELITAGYLRAIPSDPITGRNDTWKVEGGPSLKVHSGSDRMGSNGTPYSSW
jgi:hypothetical protein